MEIKNKNDLIKISTPLTPDENLDNLINKIGDSQIVMLGSSSHGNSEFYRWRTKITKRLIEEKKFGFLAFEADWPDCFEINRFVKGYESQDILDIIKDFTRWPTWMLSNWEIVELTRWMKEHNKEKQNKVGFYGIDVYSLDDSIQKIVNFLKDKNLQSGKIIDDLINCYEKYLFEPQEFIEKGLLIPDYCKDEIINMLKATENEFSKHKGNEEEDLDIEQNAYVVANAQKYYNEIFRGGAESWNIREVHMMDTINRIIDYFGKGTKVIIWAHNSHIGDARATSMSDHNLINIGQLAREEYGNDVKIVGFGSYEGKVSASREWEEDMEEITIEKAKKNSWEYVLHHTEPKVDKYISFEKEIESLNVYMEHRAIGVIYQPENDYETNYVPSLIQNRYDYFIFFNTVEPLHIINHNINDNNNLKTYPWGE